MHILPSCKSVHCECKVPVETKRGCRIHGGIVTDNCELPFRCWVFEANSSTLKRIIFKNMEKAFS